MKYKQIFMRYSKKKNSRSKWVTLIYMYIRYMQILKSGINFPHDFISDRSLENPLAGGDISVGCEQCLSEIAQLHSGESPA